MLWEHEIAGSSPASPTTTQTTGARPYGADFIDRIEVGRRVAGHSRVAFAVDDSIVASRVREAGGAEVVAPPTLMPW